MENRRVALVTAGSKGIGKSIVESLLEKDYLIIANSRSVHNLENNLTSHKNLYLLPGDITAEVTREKLYDYINKRFGKLDVLINNVPGKGPQNFEDLVESDFVESFREKLISYMLTIQTFLPLLKRSNAGRVINIVGTMGIEPDPFMFINGLVNASIVNANKSLSVQYAKDGITFNCVNPGNIDTERYKKVVETISNNLNVERIEAANNITKNIPVGRVGSVREISELVSFLASKDSSFITGQQINVDGGKLKST